MHFDTDDPDQRLIKQYQDAAIGRYEELWIRWRRLEVGTSTEEEDLKRAKLRDAIKLTAKQTF